MAITCKVCHTELDAFSGGRCRQCRQLVCLKCVAEGEPNSPGGLLCTDCAAHQAKLPAEATLPEATVIRRRFTLPAWTWSLALALLAGTFLYVVVKPYIEESMAVELVIKGTDAEFHQGLDDLSRSGGRFALGKLEEYAKKAGEPVRTRALRGIGALPGDKPVETLNKMRTDPKTPAEVLPLIFEALLEHRIRHEP